jgi:hypothetical protein
MSAVCQVCGKVWAGPTLGRINHCDSKTRAKIDATKAQPYKVEKAGERLSGRTVCECGQEAVRASSCDTSSRVCQRCYDCEIGGYSIRPAKARADHTYKVRLPRKNL